MLKHLNERRQDEQGFTLIELMVVVLIMGILMAIAIPTFLSTQGSANDSNAKSNATNVLTSEKAYYEDNQTFLDAFTGTTGNSLDPNMPWAATKDTTILIAFKNTVIAEAGTTTAGAFVPTAATPFIGQSMLIEDLSKSGTCFYIFDNEASSTAPILAYAESNATTGCLTPTATGFPIADPTSTTANAGSNILATAAAFTTTTWYTSW